jgi:3-hydroxyacyl-CoA dehydrogenase/enoyl-CoA hydratase/3-hydroxybutyryl-CoA epimerase
MGRGTTSATPYLRVDKRGIGWITFDDPDRKVNVLTAAVMHRLAAVVEETRAAATEGRIRVAVIVSGKAESFIAGADVDAIAAVEDPVEAESQIRMGQAIYTAVESLSVPTLAAIHGVCVGGGTELALACRHRVLSDSPRTRIGLPEVTLGILPAWGGTTRLPRLVGLQAALDLLLTGKQIDARQARRIGLAGDILPAEVFRDELAGHALALIEAQPGSSRPKRTLITRLLDDTAPGRRAVLATARRRVRATTGGHYPAPMRILEVLRDNLGRSVERSFDAEARAASELVVSPVCQNLVHVFRLREASRKGPTVASEGAARPMASLGIVGAGVMGGGIAQLAAYRGVRVRMKDIRHEAVTGGLQHARVLFDKAVQRRRLSPREADQRMELLSGGLDYTGFGAVDMAVETVAEQLDVKRSVLSELEGAVSDTCVLATNTSSLSVDLLARALRDPDRFCGMHFFNPVHRMPLVEVVRGARTSDETVATVHAFALALGKVPVVVRDGPGFVVNRVLGPYLNEAGWLLEEGATVQGIDRVATEFGMPMGPLRLIDEVGIDVSTHAGSSMHEALGERLAPSPALRALGAGGRLGRKGERGFYIYEKGVEEGVDQEIYGELGLAAPRERGGPDGNAIRQRLLIAMINEAARILEDGIVDKAGAVDLAMIMGTGFPPFRGGLLRFADTLHPRDLLARTRGFEERLGPRFAPPPLLEDLARRARGFYKSFGG